MVISFLTAAIFLLDIFLLLHSFSDLLSAFTTRSTGLLLKTPCWIVLWPTVIFIRFNVYFTPTLTILAFVYFLKSYIFRKKNDNKIGLIILLYFVFGLIHVLLYLEGSFGHPYWIYYFIPFIVFSSSSILYKLYLNHKYFLILLLAIPNIYFFIKVENWKINELKANLWRYDIAKKIDTEYLSPYEKISINKDSFVDPDMFMYQFKHEVLIADPKDLNLTASYTNHYIYSCSNDCLNNKYFNLLLKNRMYKKEIFDQGIVYVFSLKNKTNNKLIYNSVKTQNNINETSINNNNTIKNIYNYLLVKLHMSQL